MPKNLKNKTSFASRFWAGQKNPPGTFGINGRRAAAFARLLNLTGTSKIVSILTQRPVRNKIRLVGFARKNTAGIFGINSQWGDYFQPFTQTGLNIFF